jgi:voltage-gated potassium channel
MLEWLRYWYEADSRPAQRFRYGLLAFDAVTVIFVITSSFTRDAWWVEALDVGFGLLILADFTARLLISRHRGRDLLHPATWADVVAILSFLAPLAGEAGGFLRVLRTLRLLQTYQLLARLRADSPWFRRNEELALSIVHLVFSCSS